MMPRSRSQYAKRQGGWATPLVLLLLCAIVATGIWLQRESDRIARVPDTLSESARERLLESFPLAPTARARAIEEAHRTTEDGTVTTPAVVGEWLIRGQVGDLRPVVRYWFGLDGQATKSLESDGTLIARGSARYEPVPGGVVYTAVDGDAALFLDGFEAIFESEPGALALDSSVPSPALLRPVPEVLGAEPPAVPAPSESDITVGWVLVALYSLAWFGAGALVSYAAMRSKLPRKELPVHVAPAA